MPSYPPILFYFSLFVLGFFVGLMFNVSCFDVDFAITTSFVAIIVHLQFEYHQIYIH